MTADLPEPLDGPEYADVAARVLGGWNAGLTGDHAARLVATVEATRRVVDAAIARAEKAEADVQVLPERWSALLAERDEWRRLYDLASGERDRAVARLTEIGQPMQFRVCQSPRGVVVDWTDVASGYMEFVGDSHAGRARLEFRAAPACRSCGDTSRVLDNPPLCSNCANYGAGLVGIPSRAAVEQQAGRDERHADG